MGSHARFPLGRCEREVGVHRIPPGRRDGWRQRLSDCAFLSEPSQKAVQVSDIAVLYFPVVFQVARHMLRCNLLQGYSAVLEPSTELSNSSEQYAPRDPRIVEIAELLREQIDIFLQWTRAHSTQGFGVGEKSFHKTLPFTRRCHETNPKTMPSSERRSLKEYKLAGTANRFDPGDGIEGWLLARHSLRPGIVEAIPFSE